MFKLNLGSESNILAGWENMDNRPFLGVKYWAWNEPIPYPDNSAEIVLIQHVLMYLSPKDYAWNLKEIYRVLSPGAKFILKEEDDRKYQWRKLGTKHKTGHIIGSTNPIDIIPHLENAGFKNFVTNPNLLIEKYGDIINRQRKLLKGMLFIVESEK